MSAKLTDEINFCIRCAEPLIMAERFGAIRPACPRCEWVYFTDPKVAAAALVERNETILLVRRANDPQRGLWTLPAGFIDAGEDPQQAVVRECLEETGLQIEVTQLIDVLAGQEHARGSHLLIVYQGVVLSGDINAADDVDMAAFFPLDELPPLAFTTTQRILNRWKLSI